MRRTHLLVAAGLSAALALGALGTTGCTASTEGTVSADAKTLTDAYGREVEVPAQVERVATVGSGARFVVYAGAQDKLVAATDMDVEPSPARPYTVAQASAFEGLPSTSNGNHLMETSVNAEALLEVEPDVVISSRSAEECDDLQESTGIPVVGISYQDELFSDDVYASIEAVGEACGTQEHAATVVEKLKGWESDLDERTRDIPDDERPTCYVGAVNYKGAKSFGGTYAHYAPAEAVNAVNVADELDVNGSADVSLEQLGAWDPDYLFLNMGNMDLMSQDYADNQAFFDTLTAFQEGNLYSQPSFNMNGTNIEMGVADAYFIGFTLYPEAFADLDPAEVYDDIFETMLGTPYYETMQENGMDFKQVSFGE